MKELVFMAVILHCVNIFKRQ